MRGARMGRVKLSRSVTSRRAPRSRSRMPIPSPKRGMAWARNCDPMKVRRAPRPPKMESMPRRVSPPKRRACLRGISRSGLPCVR